MRPVCLWLSAAVWGIALTLSFGSAPLLRAEEPRDREHQERAHHDHEHEKPEHRAHDEKAHEHRDGNHHHDHPPRDDHDRDRHAGDHRDHEPHDRDHDHDGHPAIRDAVHGELFDVARAFRRIDQSYAFRGMQGCGSCTAGSAFVDWHARGGCSSCGGRVLPPAPLVFGGCRSAGCNSGCNHGYSLNRRICGGCGHVYPMGERSGCGCGGFNLRPAPPMPNDHQRSDCSEAEGCTILDRRICTGCGHVYPKNEQPHCRCHGGEAHHAPHHGPEHGPVHGHYDGPRLEPTPVEHEPAPPRQ